MKIALPDAVKTIIHTLESHGYEACAVGGCVRDSVIGREPADWDITTSAKPLEVKALFSHTIDTGIQHGTVTVMIRHTGYEVTTYRVDGEYLDGRHPESVTFTPNLVEDLKRRDFTINAMAYSDERGLVDEFGGVGDLKRGIIRCVGDPEARFTEDALRMLRAVRFAAQLGFALDESTKQAITHLAANLDHISKERIQVELVKLVTSAHPEMIELAYECGLTAQFLPEFDAMMQTPQNTPHHCYDVGRHTIEVMKGVPATKTLRLAALLHDVGKPACRRTDAAGVDHFKGHPAAGAEMARKIMRRLRFDNETTDRVVQLVKNHDERPILDERHVRRAIVRVGIEAMPELFLLKRADMLAQSMYQREEKLAQVDGFCALYEQIREKHECLSIHDLAVSGRDLIEAGIPQGRQVGDTLRALLDDVLDDPSHNTREYLMGRVSEIAGHFRPSA